MANANFFSPDGGITRYPLEDTEGRTTYEEEIHGINLLDINLADLKSINTSGAWNGNAYTINGITFTLQNNNTITGNGTASADTNFDLFVGEKAWDYVVKGTPTDGSSSTYYLTCNVTNSIDGSKWPKDTGNGVRLYSNNPCKRIRLSVLSGVTISNAVFMPMIVEPQYASIPYRPYNQQSIQHQLNDITGVTGVRNLSPFNPVIQALNGVTSTKRDNGTVRYNGTATATSWFGISQPTSNPGSDTYTSHLEKGSYKLIINSTATTQIPGIAVALFKPNADPIIGWQTINSHIVVRFDLTEYTTFYIGVRFAANVVATDLDIQAYVIPTSDPDDTYVPFAMTNRELTEKAAVVDNLESTAFCNKGTLSSSDDLDNIDATGLYFITSAPAHTPSGRSYSPLLVFRRNSSDIRQVLYGNDDCIYIRSKGGSPATWASWVKFTGTVVS